MGEIEDSVRGLLRATDDVAGWYRAVKELNPKEAVPVLLGILQDENEEQSNRRLAATMLGVLRDSRAIPALAGAMLASDRVLRGRAAEMLGEFPELAENFFLQLMQGLHHEDPYFRECCAKALGQLRRPEALPALERMRASDTVPVNREVAQSAIEAIRGNS